MNWDMIEELSKNKGEILNHTDSHPKLLELQINEVKKEFDLAEKKIISKSCFLSLWRVKPSNSRISQRNGLRYWFFSTFKPCTYK